jgi:hypothetical protein
VSKSENAHLEETAIHEAGHAAMAFIVRKKFRYVTIEEDENCWGHVLLNQSGLGAVRRQVYVSKRNRVYRRRTDAETMDVGNHLERFIAINVAGLQAVLFFYESDGREPTQEEAIRLLTSQLSDHLVALEHAETLVARKMTQRVSAGCSTALQIVMDMEDHAHEVLTHPQVWAGVRALADALLAQQTIKYQAARQIFHAAYWAEGRVSED